MKLWILGIMLAVASCAEATGTDPGVDITSSTDVGFPTVPDANPTPPDTTPSDGAAVPDATFDGTVGTDTPSSQGDSTVQDSGSGGDSAVGDDSTSAGDSPPASDSSIATDAQKDGFSSPICGEEDIIIGVEVVPPSILLVLDRSGSMLGAKWTATKEAIETVLGQVGPSMRFGLQLMPADGGCSVSTSAPEVDFALDNGPVIVQTLDDVGVGGSTPMGLAMRAAYDHFATTDPPGGRYIIMAADGKPSDTCLSDCSTCDCTYTDTCTFCADLLSCVNAEVETAVTDFAAIGGKTFVIGFEGGWGASELLNSLAEKGGTALDGDPKFYQAGDGSTLATALGDIATEVSACNAALTPPAGYYGLAVEVNGALVSKTTDSSDGWELLEGDVLQFYGPACDAVSAPDADVKVTYICKPTRTP